MLQIDGCRLGGLNEVIAALHALAGVLDAPKPTPEELRTVITLYQNTVAGAVTRYEGMVAKYMGDGVLAYFGWPSAAAM